MRNKWVGAALQMFLLSVLVSGCTEQPRPIPLGTDQSYYGRIEKGQKFGISVGQSESEASLILLKKEFRDDGVWECDFTLQQLLACNEGELFRIFRRRDLLKDGSIYLHLIDGEVSSIAWQFQLMRADF